MAFSFSALSSLCRDFCKEIDVATYQSELFLAQFHTEDRFGFTDAEQIKKTYLTPYATLISSLLASLRRSDRLGTQLVAMLESTDTLEAVEYMERVELLWKAYEQYRSDLSDFLSTSNQHLSNKEILQTKGTAPLVMATRILIASQARAKECFLQSI